MAFKGAMSGFKPKFDDDDDEAGGGGEGDDEEAAEGEEDDDQALGETLIKAIRAGTGSTVVEMIRRIAASK